MIRQLDTCLAVQAHLEAFADGELRGDVLRRVSEHVEHCGDCGAVVEGVQNVGSALRGGLASDDDDFDELAGLADGVVSRIRAEERESWRGRFERATDDLHWVVVGAGSIAAAFLTALSVSVVMYSSVEQRPDSLASVLNTAASPPQIVFTTIMPASLAPDSIVGANGEDDVEFANLAEVNPEGHVMKLERVPLISNDISASDAQPVVNQLRSVRFAQPERSSLDPASRQFVWLHTATEVRGKQMSPNERREVWFKTTPGKKVL